MEPWGHLWTAFAGSGCGHSKLQPEGAGDTLPTESWH